MGPTSGDGCSYRKKGTWTGHREGGWLCDIGCRDRSDVSTGRGAPGRLAPPGAGGGRGASQSPSRNQPGPHLDCGPVASRTERAMSLVLGYPVCGHLL